MKNKLLLVIAMSSLLMGCGQNSSNSSAQTSAPNTAVNTSITTAAVLPPKYLSIDGFKNCLGTKTQGAAQMWCLPKQQPKQCADKAWESLNSLQGNDSVPSC